MNTIADLNTIENIIEAHRGKPGSLIRVLMDIQHINGWLPKAVLENVAEALAVPITQVMHIATFYKTFSLKPKGRHDVHVCTGTSCHLRGGAKVLDEVQRELGIRPGETDAEGRFSLQTGSCLGTCCLGPEIVIDGEHHERMTPEKAKELLDSYR